MPLPAEADQVIIMGFLLDEITGGGLAAEVKSEPVALSGQAPVPMVLSAVSHAHIQTRPRTATPDPTTGFWALMALSTNDPDLEAYGGRRITLPGQTPRDVEVPYNAGQMTVTTAIAAQVNPGNVAGLPRVGDTVRAAWFHQLAGFVAPTPANAYLTQSQTIDLIAQAVSQGGGSGTSDLPEVDRTAAASTPTDLLTKTTRFSTASAAINQTLPAAQPGRQLAVGWDAGTNALTLTAAGSDVVGAGSATTVPFAVLGHLVTLHCTVAGRWRVTSGFTPQAAQDARYMPRPDEAGAAAGKVVAVAGTNPVTYALVTPSGGGGGTTLTQTGTKTGAYTAADNQVVPLDTAAGAFTLTGPTSGAPFGARWKAGAAAPTIAAPSGYTINGQPSIAMGLAPDASSGELVIWQAVGTDYQPFGGFKPQTAIDTRNGRALNLARARGSALVRQMAAAPPHAPLLMDTPPVVTQGTTITTGLTASYGAERVRWTGPLSDTPQITGAMQPRGTTNGADGTQNWRAEAAEMWFDFDGRYLDISLRASASLRYRVWADGEAASSDLVLLPSGTGANAFLKLDFGSARRTNPRRITVEFEDTSTAISVLALRAAPTDYLAPSPGGQRWIVVGDSQARGQGPTRWSFSYARTLGRLLGVQDWWSITSSSPGTGLVAGSAPVGPYGPRAQYDVIPYLRAGDVLVIQGSVNDFAQAGNVGPALEAYVNQIRAARPDVGIVVTGLAYIGTPDTDRVTVNAELKTKAAALGLPFVDMFDPVVFGGSGREGGTTGDGPADWGRRSDYTHFTDDGAWMYARRVAALLSAAVGIPQGDLKVNKATVGLGLVPNSAGGGGASVGDVMAALQPPIASGQYFFPVSATAITQNGTLGNGTLRVVPWLVTRPMSIARLAAEITTAGEAGSKLRLVLYADNGAGYPGALLVDAGQIAGDATGTQELTIATQALSTGLYWIGAVVQSAPTTQPFVRSVAAQSLPALVSAGATLPASGTIQVGCAAFSVSGAAPATFPATVNATSAAARVFCRTA